MYAFVGWQPHMYTDPEGELAGIIGATLVGGFALWGAADQIDRSTDIDPHANMLHAGLIGGGRVLVGAGVGYATFGLGTAAFGAGALVAIGSGIAAGGTGLFAADMWGMGWGVQEGFSSPGAYAFSMGLGGVLGGGGNLIGRSLAGRAPPRSPSMKINFLGQRSQLATAGARGIARARWANPASLSERFEAYQAWINRSGIQGKPTSEQFRSFMAAHRPGSVHKTLYNYRSGFRNWSRMADQLEGHHSYPKFLGGDPNQILTYLPKTEHVLLHQDLYSFLAPKGMSPKAGYTGADIQALFGRRLLKETMAEFYRGPGARYSAAARDFFTHSY
jgi:hypothetical protein